MENDIVKFNLEKEPICPHCGGLRGGHGNMRCPLMTLEYAQEMAIEKEQFWIRMFSKKMSEYSKIYDRYKKQIATLQGKVSILKHENNQLRKKSRPLPNSGIQSPSKPS